MTFVRVFTSRPGADDGGDQNDENKEADEALERHTRVIAETAHAKMSDLVPGPLLDIVCGPLAGKPERK